MAQIQDLHTSITNLSPDKLTTLFTRIRANRRIKPTPKARASKSNAQAKRTKSRKKAPTQQDIFSMLNGMSEEQKAKIAQQLIGK